MTTTITAPGITLNEAEAAAAEGIAAMPADLVALRNEKIQLDEQISALEARKKEIRDIFGARLESMGLQGFSLNGKVHARRSEVHTTRLDSGKLKEKHPKIWAAFAKVTDSVRVVID